MIVRNKSIATKGKAEVVSINWHRKSDSRRMTGGCA
jgi:hypothetical protein